MIALHAIRNVSELLSYVLRTRAQLSVKTDSEMIHFQLQTAQLISWLIMWSYFRYFCFAEKNRFFSVNVRRLYFPVFRLFSVIV